MGPMPNGPCSVVARQTTTLTSAPSNVLSFTVAVATATRTWDHIVIVAEENHSFNEVIGSGVGAPYINNTLVPGGMLFTNYFAISHPSEPNYFALYAGTDFGVTDDNDRTEPDPTLATVMQAKGLVFRGYSDDVNDNTDKNHLPWEYFPEGTTVEKSFTTFPADFTQLPPVSFVTPNLDNDMHNGTVAQGDSWLQSNIGAYATWAKTHNSLLLVVWDEDDGTQNNLVAAIAYGAKVSTGKNNTLYNHYSLLRAVTDSMGLSPIRNSAAATPLNMNLVTGAGGYIGPVTKLHYASGNSDGADGFNLLDVSSVDELNATPAGKLGLVWVGTCNGADAAFKSQVTPFVGNARVYGFYLIDEPDPASCSPENLKAESDYVHSVMPNAKTFVILMNLDGETTPTFANSYTPTNSGLDYVGIDPYPVQGQFSSGADYNIIGSTLTAVEAVGWPLSKVIPVYQTFGGPPGTPYEQWTLPTPEQEITLLNTWKTLVPAPAWDYAYAWAQQQSDTPLSMAPLLQPIFVARNSASP